MISDFILHIYLLILFPLCVCYLVYQLDFVYRFGFLHEFLIEKYIYIQWFCELRSQAFEIRKTNKDPEDTILLWPVLSLYNLIVGFPHYLWLMLVLSEILFNGVFQESNFLQPQTNQRLTRSGQELSV